jgi:hypothetical protein
MDCMYPPPHMTWHACIILPIERAITADLVLCYFSDILKGQYPNLVPYIFSVKNTLVSVHHAARLAYPLRCRGYWIEYLRLLLLMCSHCSTNKQHTHALYRVPPRCFYCAKKPTFIRCLSIKTPSPRTHPLPVSLQRLFFFFPPHTSYHYSSLSLAHHHTL